METYRRFYLTNRIVTKLDTFRLIGLFSDEANREAERIMDAPMNFVDTSGSLIRNIDRESGISLYMMTRD